MGYLQDFFNQVQKMKSEGVTFARGFNFSRANEFRIVTLKGGDGKEYRSVTDDPIAYGAGFGRGARGTPYHHEKDDSAEYRRGHEEGYRTYLRGQGRIKTIADRPRKARVGYRGRIGSIKSPKIKFGGMIGSSGIRMPKFNLRLKI